MGTKYNPCKESSKKKLEILREYIKGYIPKILNTFCKCNFVDAFCGVGIYKQRSENEEECVGHKVVDYKELESNSIIKGSPLIFLEETINYILGQNRIYLKKCMYKDKEINFWFNDIDTDSIEILQNNILTFISFVKSHNNVQFQIKFEKDKDKFLLLINDVSINVNFLKIDYRDFIGYVIDNVNVIEPYLFFLDPHDLSVDGKLLTYIIDRVKYSEILFFIPTQTISRGGKEPRVGKIRNRKEELLGNCLEETNPRKIHECMEKYLQKIFLEKGKELYVKVVDLQSRGNIYGLVYLGKHKLGANWFFKVVKKVTKSYKGFRVRKYLHSKHIEKGLFSDLLNPNKDEILKFMEDFKKIFRELVKRYGYLSNEDILNLILKMGFPIDVNIKKEIKKFIADLEKEGFIRIKRLKDGAKDYGINEKSLNKGEVVYKFIYNKSN